MTSHQNYLNTTIKNQRDLLDDSIVLSSDISVNWRGWETLS